MSSGLVWCPYSVTQIGAALRLNHFFSSSLKRGSEASETFGHLHDLGRPRVRVERIRVVRPRVELEPRVRLGDELRELPGRVRVRDARHAPVASARGGLADRDLRHRVPGLDPRVCRRVQLRVVGGGDGLAGGVELGRQEEVEVRLVPDRVEAHEREAAEAARVAGRDRPRERGEVGHPPRDDVRIPSAVRPAGRSRDREHDLHVGELRGSQRFVDVVELVCRVERARRIRRALRRGEVPLHEQAHDRRTLARRGLDAALTVRHPAEARIVVEADPHPLGGHGGRRGEGGKCAQGDDEADGASHKISFTLRRCGIGSSAARGSRHRSGANVWVV